ncbi:nucleotidyltransferase family protein [Portibacter lacus]|uniref:Nucleotidyltransferase n=1 Tax=Portibacter lacus TaxID=1099794 RepID=A0AA37WFB2_9BACT|nr:sugar phosphate nucleotidyltransferase [Portibacter lacus]GLR18357.1 nucleotidyltransferase [Portibacter lacus]
MKNKTLLVLAAGMGSRYGGLKQMDAFGPNGETIIDYSIYDAIDAGFNKIVFIVRAHFLSEFKEVFDGKFGDKVKLEYVTQELTNIPSGIDVHPEREKPWGTMHAVLVAAEEIKEPFCVINGDDYYGKDCFKIAAKFFEENENQDTYAVISYLLSNTLSEHGTVNRGVCNVSDEGSLIDIKECVKIGIEKDGTISYPENDGKIELAPETLVSMNLFAFYPSLFEHAGQLFTKFLQEHGKELKSEFYIPTALDTLIKNEIVDVKVLKSESVWFGVTYKEDKPVVIEKLNALIADGVYPENLWG